jgi:NAD+ synthase (glutamine-hydrolysing)
MVKNQATSNLDHPTSRLVKIAGATLNQTPFDWLHNTNNILAAIDAAKHEHVKILCLPELCITGYGCEDLFSATGYLKAWEELEKIKKHCENITVCLGFLFE